jgi:hypothetical protein
VLFDGVSDGDAPEAAYDVGVGMKAMLFLSTRLPADVRLWGDDLNNCK